MTADAEITGSGSSGESCPELRPAAGGDLDDVTHTRPRQQQSAGPHRPNTSRSALAVQQHHVDREAHPERVDGPALFQQETVVRRKVGASEESSRSLTARFRNQERPPLGLHAPHTGDASRGR
jgi:hypothetical protein